MTSDRASLDLRHFGLLTDAELECYRKIDVEDRVGPREFARQTERSPGTIGNLLRRAREKVEEADAS